MAIKNLSVKTTGTTAPKGKSTVPVYQLPVIGARDARLVEVYTKRTAEVKEAQAELDEIAPLLKAAALAQLYTHNITHTDPTSSVKVQDTTGATALVTMQNRYGAVDAEAAEATILELNPDADINDYVQMTVKASFDASIFISQVGNDKGEFSKPVYDAYLAAITAVTDKLIKAGKLSPTAEVPLKTVPVAAVRDSFHTLRWEAFPTAAAQARLQEVMKATITAAPVATV